MACTLSNEGESKAIEPKCMELLVLLIKAEGEVISRTEIMDTIWQGRYVTEHVLNNLVATLRKHLKDGDTTYIKTRPKRGYQLMVSVSAVVESEQTEGEMPEVFEHPAGTFVERRRTPSEKPHQHVEPSSDSGSRSWLKFAGVFGLVVLVFVWWQLSSSKPSEEPYSIAVVPFEVHDSQEQTEHFAQGLVEETLHQLSSKTDFSIISRPKSFWDENRNTFAGLALAEQGNQPDFFLEGSVRPEQQLLRVTVRLVSGETGNLLWSRVFTANTNATMVGQSEISEQLAQTINDSLQNPEALIELEQKSVPQEAYLHVLRGRKLNSDGTMESHVKALDEFQMATMIAPNYLEAHADLALNYLILAQRKTMDPDDANRMALASLQRALAIDPEHAKSHSMKATYHQNMGEDEQAELAYQKALSIDPELYVAAVNYANLLRLQYRFEESLKLYQKAKFLAPRSRPANWAIGSILINLGLFEEAIAHYQSCMELLSDFDGCVAGLAYAQRLTNLNDEADGNLALYRQMVQQDQYWPLHVLAWHPFWLNDGDTSMALYQSLLDKHGVAIDGIHNIVILKWQSNEIEPFIEVLQQEVESNADHRVKSALAHASYLTAQCEEGVPYLEALLDESTFYFDSLEFMFRGISYRAALAYCYKETGQMADFEAQLTLLSENLNSVSTEEQNAPGYLFVKGQFLALSDEKERALEVVRPLQEMNLILSWMAKNDPILKKGSESFSR